MHVNPQSVEHQALDRLLVYWREKCRDRSMPSRADIVPSELREHLASLVILDVLPGGMEFRYRLIGTLVSQYFMKDNTGKTVTEAFTPETVPHLRDRVLGVMRKVVRDKAVVLSIGEPGTLGPRTEDFQTLCMPLSDDGENVHHILMGFAVDRARVLLAREIAKGQGGVLPEVPPGTSRKS